jgi:hypothetical protein
MRKELARKIAYRAVAEGDMQTAVPGLRLYRRSATTACASAAYEPSLVVFRAGTEANQCRQNDLPVRRLELPADLRRSAGRQPGDRGNGKEPILGLLLKLEMPAVREILSQQEFHLREESADARGMAVGVTSIELLDACSRLVDLLDAPQDIPFLGSLIQREIIYGCCAARRESICAPSPPWESRAIGHPRQSSG